MKAEVLTCGSQTILYFQDAQIVEGFGLAGIICPADRLVILQVTVYLTFNIIVSDGGGS